LTGWPASAHRPSNVVWPEFGNYHVTSRTSGNDPFINPLMSQYWTFQSAAVVRRMAYAGQLAETDRVEEVRRIIDLHRETSELRPFRAIPL
jgi:hypothetical protein